MRIGILASSLPRAIDLYRELTPLEGVEIYILLCPVERKMTLRQALVNGLSWLASGNRLQALRLLWERKVIFFTQGLDHPEALSKLGELGLDIGLHKSNTIYREPTIRCFKTGILNFHIGLLPEFRGRSVMEWSLMRGKPVGFTVFFIDAGIDTGERIVFSRAVDISRFNKIQEAKNYLFGRAGENYKKAIELIRSKDFSCRVNDGAAGTRYYLMSDCLLSTVDEILTFKPVI